MERIKKQKPGREGPRAEKLIKVSLGVHRTLKIKAAEQGKSIGKLVSELATKA